jgi:hypothetical protein
MNFPTKILFFGIIGYCYLYSQSIVALICRYVQLDGGLSSSVGIATGYGLDGLGIESRWGRDFLHLSRPALGPTQPPVK